MNYKISGRGDTNSAEIATGLLSVLENCPVDGVDVSVDFSDNTIRVETDGVEYKYRLVPVEVDATEEEKPKSLKEILSEYLIDWPDLGDRKFQ